MFAPAGYFIIVYFPLNLDHENTTSKKNFWDFSSAMGKLCVTFKYIGKLSQYFFIIAVLKYEWSDADLMPSNFVKEFVV